MKEQSTKGDLQMSETEKKVEDTIEETIEELENKIAPEAVSRIALNHNETLVRDQGEQEKK